MEATRARVCARVRVRGVVSPAERKKSKILHSIDGMR